MDELLDFSSDIGEDEDDDDTPLNSSLNHHLLRRRNPCPSLPLLRFSDGDHTPPFPQELPEEELEWISNKDAFPMIESLVDIMPNHPSIATTNTFNTTSNSNYNSNHQSPISVLENSSSSFTSNASHGTINNQSVGNMSGSGSMMMVNLASNFKVPGARARSKIGRRRRDSEGQEFFCWSVHEKKASKKPISSKMSSTIGRKCLHCGSEKTPQWRAGPLGPKTLCNACGVRYKSGRLCDEYRPASSPTFSSKLHSNSHRKIVEMRRQKMPPSGSVLKPAEMG